MVRVAINGFGRIGRMMFRAALGKENIEFVAVNDLTDTKTLAYLLKHDSVHGKIPNEVTHDDHNIYVDGKQIMVFSERDPEKLPWGEHNIDVVVESTGFFRTREAAEKHVHAGAKRVLISAPAKSDDVGTFIIGVNQDKIGEENIVISNASCTSNSLAPMVQVLHDNFGIENGLFRTIHGYTADQRHVDGPHSDLRRARACAINIVPTSSGAAVAVTKAIPELDGKLTGMAYRVPIPDGSITEFSCTLKREATAEEINGIFKNIAEHQLKGILQYSEEPLVSTDIIGNPHSCIFDASLTLVIDGRKARVVGWYDNEWGYSNRLAEMLEFL